MTQTGRGNSGRLRNFAAMNDEKLAGVQRDILAESNDPDAVAAVTAEVINRGGRVEAAVPAESRVQPFDPTGGFTIDGSTAMLAKAPSGRTSGVSNQSGWLLEPKYDGHRMIARVTSEGVSMFARSGVNKTGKMPAIEAALADLPPCILDGEIIANTGWGGVQEVLGADTAKAADRSGGLSFVIFDVLQVMGEDVRSSPLTRRREMLNLLLTDESNVLFLSPQSPYTAEAVTRLIEDGWEGAVVKDPKSTYQSGRRSPSWIKIKATETEDVVVMGATPGKGKYDGMVGALVFGQYDEIGVLTEKGRCSGMTDQQREAFTHARNAELLFGTVIEVRHMGKLPTGGWRHPQFLRTRTDKDGTECVSS